METVVKSENMRLQAERLIRESPLLEDLREADVRIGYCYSDKVKTKAGGRLVLGECRKVSEAYKAFMPYDFVIIFYAPNAEPLTEEQMDVLMTHELMHVGFTENGDTKYRIIPHDVEDFREIINMYGVDWAEADGE